MYREKYFRKSTMRIFGEEGIAYITCWMMTLKSTDGFLTQWVTHETVGLDRKFGWIEVRLRKTNTL